MFRVYVCSFVMIITLKYSQIIIIINYNIIIIIISRLQSRLLPIPTGAALATNNRGNINKFNILFYKCIIDI